MAQQGRFGRRGRYVAAPRNVVAFPAARRTRGRLFGGSLWSLVLVAAFGAVLGLGAGLLDRVPALEALFGPAAPASLEPATRVAGFGLCDRGTGYTCVIDGDTFRLEGVPIRIADIDTPEARNYGCASEKRLADRATTRLVQLLNAGPFALQPADRDTDAYGRKLRIVTRDGASLGAQLVSEGLARPWTGARQPWC